MSAPLLDIERLEVPGATALRIPHLLARSRHLAIVEDAPSLRSAVLLSLFRKPTQGTHRKFTIEGVPVGDALASGAVGYAPRLLDDASTVSVREVLEAGARLLGAGSREVREALERVGLAPRTKDSLARLTALEHRLLGLAHALVGRPRTLVVEPLWQGLTRPELDHLERVATALLAEHRWVLFGGTGSGSEREFLESVGFFSRLTEAGASEPKALRAPSALRVLVRGERERLAGAFAEEGLSFELCFRADGLVVRGLEANALLTIARRVAVEVLEIVPDGPLGAGTALV